MTESLAATLRRRSNNHSPVTTGFEALTGYRWHEPTPARLAAGHRLSVVIPAHNVAHCLRYVLDALAVQSVRDAFEVIVVDDASTDETLSIARAHPIVLRLVRIRERAGAATARNVGTALAGADTILYLDADMVLPRHVIADVMVRAAANLALIGFRHNLPYKARQRVQESGMMPDLYADHRARWRPPVGRRLMYSGLVLDRPLDGRPLDHTKDLRDLGFGRGYYDWDLPRMVVTALLAVPREAVLDVGGFDPEFGRLGWGMEDTHLGAKLIASGLLVVPLRQAVGFHLDPPDAEAQWRAKLIGWRHTLAYYRGLLQRPAPTGRTHEFTTHLNTLRAQCEVLR
ncbi:glycosyltransferase family 2 protein [Thermomonospora echinospora]|uniref:glycosyltransferase family 2 protein n=1 Tax=Thermomonospora echinospora TaxID=1992 RepID=UPI000CDE5822|nr:glycosyltransferase family 2 protein [Thermomonospora echinospora]